LTVDEVDDEDDDSDELEEEDEGELMSAAEKMPSSQLTEVKRDVDSSPSDKSSSTCSAT